MWAARCGAYIAGPGLAHLDTSNNRTPRLEAQRCLAEGEDGDWLVVRAGAPVRVDGDAVDPGAAALPLGDGAYPLRFVLTPLDEFASHRVWVQGALVGAGGVGGINVSRVESVAETCE